MIARTRLATLLTSLVLVATLVPAIQASADDTPTPSPSPTVEAVAPEAVSPDDSAPPLQEFSEAAYPSSGPGTVTVSRGAHGLVATTSAWPAGTTFSYQWYRGSRASTATTPATGAGATTANYSPNSADRSKYLRVRVTATNAAAFTGTAKRYSTAKKHSIVVSEGGATVLGFPPVVGNTVHLEWTELTVFTSAGEALPSEPLLESGYQWLRNGNAITGANSATYTLKSADIGARISARATATLPGTTPTKITSFSSEKVQGLPLTPVSNPLSLNISAGAKSGQVQALIGGGFDQSGVKLSVQWYRNGSKVKDATKPVFTLKSTDAGDLISYVVTAKKSGYQTRTFTAIAHDFGIRVDSPETGDLIPIYGAARVGGSVHVDYDSGNWKWVRSETGATVTPVLKYQWYRGSTKISGATYSHYTPIAADFGKYLSVRVYASGPGMVAASSLSGPTSIGLGENYLDGDAYFGLSNPSTNTLQAYVVNLLPVSPAPVLTYQWTRDNVDIPGATKSTYKLNDGADYRADIRVEITLRRERFVPGDDQYTITSNPQDFTAIPGVTGEFTGAPVFGVPFAAPSQTYDDAYGNEITTQPNYRYQWVRAADSFGNGAQLIVGATNATYTPKSADIGKFLFVYIGATIPGYLRPGTPMSDASVRVQAATIAGTLPIEVSFSDFTLKGRVAKSSITTSGVTYSYRWYHDGVSVRGATKTTYKPASSQRSGDWWLQVTVTKPGYTTRVFEEGIRIL